MSKVRFSVAISLDGFLAGPQQSLENPLGVGGLQIHEWVFPLAAWRAAHGEPGGVVNASTRIIEESQANVGAVVMGRNMFGGQPGPWGAEAWRGWWGENPPYHAPVFVLTHHPRPPLPMQGGTTFTFVTEGFDAAMRQARQAAGAKDVVLAGGAQLIQQGLAAGVVDEINVSVVPLLLRAGERLFDHLPAGLKLEQERTVEAPGVSHLRYRIVR
jgi:dihydrofolate reductase